MKILFISNDLIAGNIAHLLTQEGHQVRLYIGEKGRRLNFDNLVKKTSDWRKDLAWVTKKGLIVFDDVGYGYHQTRLRNEGYKVFGGSELGDLLEQDRVHAQEIFTKYGINTVPIFNFDNIDKAIRFVKKNIGPWVVKQNGSSSKSLNYVGRYSDNRDLIDILNTYKKNGFGSEIITLQKKIVGVEIAATRYFNGKDWIGPTLINIEHKKFFPGDLGPTTSEMGTIGWYDNNEDNKLFCDTLAKIKPYLQHINYRGVFDINCIVNEDGTFPLEATSRPGSPIIHLQTELDISPWSDILLSIADQKPYKLKYKSGFGIVVVIAIPPFPYAKKIDDHSQIGTNLYFDDTWNDSDLDKIHFEEISYNKATKKYYVSDNRGYVLYVTGTGTNIEEARSEAYKIIDKIHVPKMMYRNDIGLKFVNETEELLRNWGYIK
jgi:phosphoribosylamine--glycine ligase